MTRNERIAEFSFKGAGALSFTVMGGILTSGLNGTFAKLEFDEKLLLGGFLVGIALTAILLLVSGWLASPKEPNTATETRTPSAPTYWAPTTRDIILFTPCDHSCEGSRTGTSAINISINGRNRQDVDIRVRGLR